MCNRATGTTPSIQSYTASSVPTRSGNSGSSARLLLHAHLGEGFIDLVPRRSAHAAADPLASVAAAVHAESPVLCFDEVELVDVADALVLKRVFEHVFALGGILIATSNAAPEELYEGGINRAAFIPFIGQKH